MDDFQKQRFILVYRNYLQGKAISRERNYTAVIQQALHRLYIDADLTIARRMEFDALRSNVEGSYYFDMTAAPDHLPSDMWQAMHQFIKKEYQEIKGIRPVHKNDRITQSNLCPEITL